MIADFEQRRANLTSTLLRIEGAMAVLRARHRAEEAGREGMQERLMWRIRLRAHARCRVVSRSEPDVRAVGPGLSRRGLLAVVLERWMLSANAWTNDKAHHGTGSLAVRRGASIRS